MSNLTLHWHCWGNSENLAVLIHGIATDATTFWQLGPLLASQGYTVLAPDLRGHGLSPRADAYQLQDFADDVVAGLPDRPIALALGHSLGGGILGLIGDQLAPERAVFVDPAWDIDQTQPGMDASTFPAMAAWNDDDLEAAHPDWTPEERAIEQAALRRWDVDTALGLHRQGRILAVPATLERPSLLLVPEGSALVPDDRQEALAAMGFCVQRLPSRDHAPHRVDAQALASRIIDWTCR